MTANYHTHTFRCHHAKGEDKQFVEEAIKSGLKILGFSDHCPWIFDDNFVSATRMLPSDLDDYFSSLETLKKEYKKDISIYIGFESEYIPELMEKQNKLLKDYPVDYMILGEHFTSREPFSAYTGFPVDDESELKKYIDLIIEGMETGKYAYVAHPDLFNFTGSDDVYEKHFSKLCQYLKDKNIPVEINMLGMTGNRHYPSEKFFKIAQKIGNTAIIGCDAHFPEQLSDIESRNNCIKFAEKFNLTLIDTLQNLE